MAVGACIKATAFSMGGIGGSRLRFCLSVYQIETFYIRLTFYAIVLTTILVGARLDQLRRSGEKLALLDAFSYLSPISFKSAILAP